jgi:hypothetical protein
MLVGGTNLTTLEATLRKEFVGSSSDGPGNIADQSHLLIIGVLEHCAAVDVLTGLISITIGSCRIWHVRYGWLKLNDIQV